MAEGGPSTTASSSSSSSYSKSNVNEEFLKSLIEMGIHPDAARQALKIVNNRSLEDALAVVFGESSFFSTEPVISTSGASVEQATQVTYESHVIPTDIDTTDETMMTYKMLFVVNGSLRMSSGKMAAQVAHSAIDLYQKIVDQRLMGLSFWHICGKTKIVVRGDSTEELLEIESHAAANKSIVTSVIHDAGRTEIASGSVTCLGLFGTNNQLDPITRHLKLMNDCLKCSGTNPQQQQQQQQKSRRNKKDREPSPNPDDVPNT